MQQAQKPRKAPQSGNSPDAPACVSNALVPKTFPNNVKKTGRVQRPGNEQQLLCDSCISGTDVTKRVTQWWTITKPIASHTFRLQAAVDNHVASAPAINSDAKPRKTNLKPARPTSNSQEDILDLWRTFQSETGNDTSPAVVDDDDIGTQAQASSTSTCSVAGAIVSVYRHSPKQNDEFSHFKRERCFEPTEVNANGIVDDQNPIKTWFQGRDTEDRAILGQFSDNYDRLRYHFPEHAGRMAGMAGQNGSGENIEVQGLTIDNTCLGDIFAVVPSSSPISLKLRPPSSRQNTRPLLLEVTSPRKPCRRWDMRYGTEDLGPRSVRVIVMKHSLGGVFFRVLREGDICAGDMLVLQHRPYAEWPISRVGSMLYGHVTGFETTRDEEDTCASAPLDDLRTLRHIPQLGIREWKEVIEDVLADKEGRESQSDLLRPHQKPLMLPNL